MPEENMEPRLLKPETENPAGEETESYSPVVHGKATDSIAVMAGNNISANAISGTASITFNGVTMDINDFNVTKGTLGISTHKLLNKAIAEFTKLNHTGTNSRKIQSLKMYIPLKEYATLCGYDPTNKTELDNCRKEVKKDLNLLYNSTLSWDEKVRGKEEPFVNLHILGGVGYSKGTIYIEFTQSMGEYLIKLPLTLLPDSLYKVDGRSHNAYNMGLKIIEHYNMDNNIKTGTAPLLKVKTLLSVTTLPTYEQLGANNRFHWVDRIKEKFENALDTLKQCGVLEDYYYSYPKGVRIPDEEIGKLFDNYYTWIETLVYFTLKDAPDQTPRLEAREAECKAKQENKRGKKRARKKAAEKKSSPSTGEETAT